MVEIGKPNVLRTDQHVREILFALANATEGRMACVG